MSRGLVFGNSGRAGRMAVTGMSGELIAASATGSAARAQHPHVTHAGGQLLSLLPAGSLAVQGSALTRLTKPDALNVSTATMMARANRRTTIKSSTQRPVGGIARHCPCAKLSEPGRGRYRKELRYGESADYVYVDARRLERSP